MRSITSFAWHRVFGLLRERFSADRLGVSAGSLTFTSMIAMVPFFTVLLSLFTAFPVFSKLQKGMQKWLVDSLIPDNIAQQVLSYLTQFASKASRLGSVGLLILLFTALSLMLTMDRTLNQIWRVRTPRPLGQRVLVYWAAITLGPLLLAMSLGLTSYAVSISRGLVGVVPSSLQFLLDSLEFGLTALAITALFHYVPNTRVKWGHAAVGGIFVSLALMLSKQVLAWYLGKVPTYSVIYGAFAAVPILLVWIYWVWLIILWGAVLAAHVPDLLRQRTRDLSGPGSGFQLALEVLQALYLVQHASEKGYSADSLAHDLNVSELQLEPVLESLVEMDWVGLLSDESDRYVLLVNPEKTELTPLVHRTLLEPSAATRQFLDQTQQSVPFLSAVLQKVV